MSRLLFGPLRTDEDFFDSIGIRIHQKFSRNALFLTLSVFLLILAFIVFGVTGPAIEIPPQDVWIAFLHWRFNITIILVPFVIFFSLLVLNNPSGNALVWVALIFAGILGLWLVVALVFLILDWTDCANVTWCDNGFGFPRRAFIMFFAATVAMLLFTVLDIIALWLIKQLEPSELSFSEAERSRILGYASNYEFENDAAIVSTPGSTPVVETFKSQIRSRTTQDFSNFNL